MGLTYRWMQKKDLRKVNNSSSFKFLLKNNRIVANVVELDNKILGYVVYEILNKKIDILKLSFCDEKIFNFIVEKIKNKPNYLIEIAVTEYDLEMHLLLKNQGFKATEIRKIEESDFYIFNLDNKK